MAWNSALCVDITSIDDQHRALAEALGQLFVRLKEGAPRTHLLTGLDTLVGAVAEHFEHEERVMRNIGMPDYETHRAQHQALLHEVAQLRRQLSEPNAPDPEAVEQFLRFWLYKHMSTTDIHIRTHLER